MAQRKRPVTEPVLDNTVADQQLKEEESRKVFTLSKEEFNTIVKQIKDGPLSRAKFLLAATSPELKRLGAKRSSAKVPKRLPKEASDHFDGQSIATWARKVPKGDKKAVSQLITINAICKQRVG